MNYPFIDVNCVCEGIKGIHKQRFADMSAYQQMQSNAMYFNFQLLDCENALYQAQENAAINLQQKYFELCNSVIEYFDLLLNSRKPIFLQKMGCSIDRLIKYLTIDLQYENIPLLKQIMKFLFQLLYFLSQNQETKAVFSEKFTLLENMNMAFNAIPQYEISNLLRCSPALNFKDKSLKLELKNPVEQGRMETVSYGRFL